MTFTRMVACRLDASLAVTVMEAVPRLRPVTRPFSSTDATLDCRLLKVTLLSVASSGSTFTRSCTFSPVLMLSSSFEFRPSILVTSWLTVTVAEADTEGLELLVQVMVQVPAFLPVTWPPLTVAIDSSEEDQVTDLSFASAGRI